MRQVFVAKHIAEAHLVRGFLEAEGIHAEVRGDALYGARGETPVTPETCPSVWVLDDGQAPRALLLVRRFERGDEPAAVQGEPWRCPKCGEVAEPQFTECWQCGTGRPVSEEQAT